MFDYAFICLAVEFNREIGELQAAYYGLDFTLFRESAKFN